MMNFLMMMFAWLNGKFMGLYIRCCQSLELVNL